jgi:hypothetical protein
MPARAKNGKNDVKIPSKCAGMSRTRVSYRRPGCGLANLFARPQNLCWPNAFRGNGNIAQPCTNLTKKRKKWQNDLTIADFKNPRQLL